MSKRNKKSGYHRAGLSAILLALPIYMFIRSQAGRDGTAHLETTRRGCRTPSCNFPQSFPKDRRLLF
jgi:hypothetical protein